jgi:hypothetical protein
LIASPLQVALLALIGCEQRPEVASGTSARPDQWLDGLPSATGKPSGLDPASGNWVGGGPVIGSDAWKPGGNTFDLGTDEPSAPRPSPTATGMNPFIGVDFAPGTGSVFADERGSISDILAKMKEADKLAPDAEYERLWVQARDMLAKNQLQEALTVFDKMRQLNSKDVRAEVGEGIVYLRRGDFKRALAALDLAARNDPTVQETYAFMAQAHLGLDNPTAALADYATLLRLNPDNMDARFGRLNLLFSRGQYGALITDADALIRLRPNLADAYLYRGLGYLLTKRTAEGQRDFEESVRLGLHKDTERMLRPRFFPVVP